jgi:hypothetical protein
MSKKNICRIIHKMMMTKDPFMFQNDVLCKCRHEEWCRIKFEHNKEYFPSNYKEFRKVCSKFVNSSKK